MKWATWLLAGHLIALLFGLAGILIAIPNSDLWADTTYGPRAYEFGMKYGGATHIIFGAAAMFMYGMAVIGLRKTGIFFACATIISFFSELIGTSTGEPFGNYTYTNFLGYKLFDHVPFSIPLSWFYVGFATFLIGYVLADMLALNPKSLFAIIFGGWLLTVWDLVLDPAMAHESLNVKFWIWSETGAYFGMPGQNFFGWALTAVLFMGLARLLWMATPPTDGRSLRVWFPAAVYILNVVFASALSASVDLWLPIAFAVVLGVIPVLATLWPGRTQAAAA
jgi:putative membrane protein